MPTINPANLRSLRTKKRWSLDDLAEKANVDRGTINRIETAKRADSRRTTVERLARALQTDVDTLTGPTLEAPGRLEITRKSQMHVRMSDDARNALSLVAMRYRVSQSAILHLAPLLFLWVAEESLKERARRLDRLSEQWDAVGPQADFAHLVSDITCNSRGEDVMESERRSIAKRDIFGLLIPDDEVSHHYEESEQNPMARFLASLTANLGGAAQFEHWSPNWDQPGYTLGREEASTLVGGDEEAVHHIICGNVALHELPKDVRETGPEGVAEWVRENGNAYLASLPDLLGITLEV